MDSQNPNIIPPMPFDSLIGEARGEKFRQILQKRSNQVTVVIENVWDPHNCTAVIRSCEAFGLDQIYIISNKHSFKINSKVSRGAHHYTKPIVYKTVDAAYQELHQQGYQIFASDLGQEKTYNTQDLANLAESQKIAVVFGEESKGLSAEASEKADGHFLIPMTGFTQSLNVSVALAVTIYAIRQKDLCQNKQGNLTIEQQTARYTNWVKRNRGPAVDRMMGHYRGNPIELEVLKKEEE